MEQEKGCGWGCGLVLLVAGVLMLCVIMPFIGLPVALILAVVAIVAAVARSKGG